MKTIVQTAHLLKCEWYKLKKHDLLQNFYANIKVAKFVECFYDHPLFVLGKHLNYNCICISHIHWVQ